MSNTPAMWTQIFGDKGEGKYWKMVGTSPFLVQFIYNLIKGKEVQSATFFAAAAPNVWTPPQQF